MRDAERRVGRWSGASSVDEAVATRSRPRQRAEDLIEAFKDVNALNAKTRMMEVRDDLQREQEPSRRASFDAFFDPCTAASINARFACSPNGPGSSTSPGRTPRASSRRSAPGGHSGGGGREGGCATPRRGVVARGRG